MGHLSHYTVSTADVPPNYNLISNYYLHKTEQMLFYNYVILRKKNYISTGPD